MSERVGFFIRGRERLAEPYHYEASGLDNIYLLNGVSETETAYGPMVHIVNVHGLHRAIGLHIAEKTEPMTGPEFRFLRKQLGFSQAALGKLMRVTDQTIANYEKGSVTSFGPADPFMRTLYLLEALPEQTRVDVLKPIIENTEERPEKLPEVPRRSIVGQWREQMECRAA
jgi:transcriptional regulator with XRE-family HTH domain